MSNENIFFTLEDFEENENETHLMNNDSVPCFCQGDVVCVFCLKEKDIEASSLPLHFVDTEFQFDINYEDEIFSRKINYQVNFTVKQLSMMCDYYEIRSRNKNKNELIEALVSFENESKNNSTILKRKKLWFYLEELRKDSFTKKYILL
jgi:hypothetical protein